eukprot:3320499-Rhodomonas_salina.1
MSAEKSAKTVTQVLEGSRNKVEFDLRQIFDLAEIEKEGKKSLRGVDVEECDDGNNTTGDGCLADGTLEFCGDCIVNNACMEECADGNTESLDGCSAGCVT